MEGLDETLLIFKFSILPLNHFLKTGFLFSAHFENHIGRALE